ncbi:hypothetical protein H072_11605 [Dactylellina haptotyla CBS 200.50]|uniref:Rhodopsin domain-containing protein n=1 Tax=Dactylellina haptotyla (strain CBS 200.50) TaxID=1284197 RepID=S8BIN9_DACHA|nr:hypothetical protein H072_11605 [Dactylellina haptotyla CBS 200.50]
MLRNGGPPHPQTDHDREFLRELFPFFKQFPPNFEFPLSKQHDPPYIPPNNTLAPFVTALILTTFTSSIVSLRLWVRMKRGFGMDDWVMLASFIFYTAYVIVSTYALFGTGLGFHLYDLSETDIRAYLLYLYLYATFLWFTVNLTRCSILHLFLRLSHLQTPKQVLYLRTILTASYLTLFVYEVSEVFECGLPISNLLSLRAYYDGTCIASASVRYYATYVGINLALDALTIFPPIVILVNTPLARKKKINLIFLLILGTIAMVVGAVRLYVFYQLMQNSFDITWTTSGIAITGCVEASFAAIVACLPALNQTFIGYYRSWFPRDGRPRVLSLALLSSLFERSHAYREPINSQTSTRNEKSATKSTFAATLRKGSDATAVAQSRRGSQQNRPMQGTSNDSYPDIITFGANYFIDGRQTDLEMQREQEDMYEDEDGVSSLAQPPHARVHFSNRRPSSPTISGAANLNLSIE